jgi:hypothetical protein
MCARLSAPQREVTPCNAMVGCTFYRVTKAMKDHLVKRLRYEYPSIKERFELLERVADRIVELETALLEIANCVDQPGSHQDRLQWCVNRACRALQGPDH